MTPSEYPTVLMTDRAWPDDRIEREVLEGAGLRLVCGPAEASSASAVEDLIRRHQPQAIMTCWAPVSASAIARANGLRLVARMGVGLDNIAVSAATELGVLVTNVPDYCVEEVSDHAVALALAWTRGIVAGDRHVRSGHWNPAGAKLRRLSSLRCGVIGYGRIGRKTVDKLLALDATVIASDPAQTTNAAAIPILELDALLQSSDIVILHAPLTAENERLIGERELSLMPEGGFLINVSRGGLIDNAALIAALSSGHLGGAGLDVIEGEPELPDGLLDHAQVIVTPHVGFSSDASVAELRRKAAEEVVRVLDGQVPHYRVNEPTDLRNGSRA